METGLYELYQNVVKRFTDAMIKESERYAGTQHPDTPDKKPPATDWISRNNYGPDTCTACTGKHGPGMSYSFGGKQTVEEYNKETGGGVARDCRISGSETEKQVVISTNGVPANNCNACHYINAAANDEKFRYDTFVKIPAIGDNYKGNVKSNSCGLDGNQKYPGLYKHELDMHKTSYTFYDMATNTMSGQTPIYPQFDPTYWAGTDCSNLVQRSVVAAKELNISGVNVTVKVSPQLGSWQYCALPPYGQNETPTPHAFGVKLNPKDKLQKKLRKRRFAGLRRGRQHHAHLYRAFRQTDILHGRQRRHHLHL